MKCGADGCEMDAPELDGGESWHFIRMCESCGREWHGLHCLCDGYQNPCPWCGVRPTVQECPCQEVSGQ